MLRFLILCAIAALSGMGVGGGGLLILYLTVAESMPQLPAQGLNLWFFLLSAFSALPFYRKNRTFRRDVLLLLCCGGLMGVLGGTLLTHIIPVLWIRRIFGGMLILSGTTVLLGKSVLGKKRA